MEEYLRKLSSYVAEHPPDMYSDDVHTILDALFWHTSLFHLKDQKLHHAVVGGEGLLGGCGDFHGHSRGDLSIGYHAALYALELLQAEFSDNEQLKDN